MENSLLSINLEKNFAFHEVLTDSDNAVKDIARLLALGVESEEIKDELGVVVKPSVPVVDKCWEVVYPVADRTAFPKIEDWNNLLPSEYKQVTEQKIGKVIDTVILRTTTIPKTLEVNNSTSIGVNADLNVKSIEMYLEIYMPPYLCDSEKQDPIEQRGGAIPYVNDVNGIASGNVRVARNYHHLFMRIFDHINEDLSGPADNEVDPVSLDTLKWESRASNWSKLSWYNDFENKFKAPLVGQPLKGAQLGTVRIPVIGGLTSESKIKLWVNVNKSRVAMGIMGSPNVDFDDNRYLIGSAYIGQIDSFDFSLNDTAGNFGLFTTSSSSPAMVKAAIKTRASVPAIVSGANITPGTGVVGSGTNIEFQTNLQLFNPGTKYSVQAVEISSIPQATSPTLWGNRFVDKSTVKLNCVFAGTPTKISYQVDGATVVRNIGIPVSAVITPDVIVNHANKKDVKINLDLEDLLNTFIGTSEATAALTAAGIKFINDTGATVPLNITYTFSYYTEYTVNVGGVVRDSFGNQVSDVLDQTYGKNTANGITDFAMYATFTKDYFQRHFFMFASTEEYMQKELYGKSVYTSEYFADRIKVVHSSEGPRGILSGMITVDTSSLYPFDELIVNKDFEKYDDKPEELYVFLPITAPYCPFANSPNGRHGIGILKDIRYPVPVTDDEIVKFAINELDRKYSDMDYVVDNFSLIETSQYGATIKWGSSDNTIINVTGI